MIRRLMAFFTSGRITRRMTLLEKRGQLTLDRADAAAQAAHRMALEEARVRRETDQYHDRLTDSRSRA